MHKYLLIHWPIENGLNFEPFQNALPPDLKSEKFSVFEKVYFIDKYISVLKHCVGR